METSCPRSSNIGPSGQDRRLRMGVAFFAVTLALAVWLSKTGAAPELRWLLAAPFFVAVAGISQALCRTCIVLAACGKREDAEGPEPILNPEDARALRSRGRRVLVASAAISIVAAGLFAQLSA